MSQSLLQFRCEYGVGIVGLDVRRPYKKNQQNLLRYVPFTEDSFRLKIRVKMIIYYFWSKKSKDTEQRDFSV